jgi:hypothetical protein
MPLFLESKLEKNFKRGAPIDSFRILNIFSLKSKGEPKKKISFSSFGSI